MRAVQQPSEGCARSVSARHSGHSISGLIGASKNDLQMRLPPEREQCLAQSFRLDAKRSDVIQNPCERRRREQQRECAE